MIRAQRRAVVKRSNAGWQWFVRLEDPEGTSSRWKNAAVMSTASGTASVTGRSGRWSCKIRLGDIHHDPPRRGRRTMHPQKFSGLFELADRVETLDVIPGPRKRNPGSMNADAAGQSGPRSASSWTTSVDGSRVLDFAEPEMTRRDGGVRNRSWARRGEQPRAQRKIPSRRA